MLTGAKEKCEELGIEYICGTTLIAKAILKKVEKPCMS